jgi:23S rRNA (cytidine1920-2'-O)/16S rRNA (cytidine1409-2'-O)-methyltransferase
MAKQRLDLLLVERHLCPSRQQAQRLIRAGDVRVNQGVVDKPGTEVEESAEVEVRQKPPYVSRGGEKLAHALDCFGIPLQDRICLDGGISTGGFTDCLLQRGAERVYGIDVGYGQVDWQLRNDRRVILRERTNLRHLAPLDLYGSDRPDDPQGEPWPDFAGVDVSFIALAKVLPALWRLLQPPREMVLLVKPQFEVGREKVGKKGVVRDPQDQAEAIGGVLAAARVQGWGDRGLTASPLRGPAGNGEYLLWLSMGGEALNLQPPSILAVTRAHQATAP